MRSKYYQERSDMDPSINKYFPRAKSNLPISPFCQASFSNPAASDLAKPLLGLSSRLGEQEELFPKLLFPKLHI